MQSRTDHKTVTLVDGTQCSGYSEAWRHECEARYLMGLGNEKMLEELGQIKKMRGKKEEERLKETIRLLWPKKKKRNSKSE